MNHFRYLLRNIDFSSNVSLFAGDTIYYNADENATYGFVSGGLGAVSDTRIFVTDRASGTTFSRYHGYRTPRAVYSDQYMLVYDRSGSSLSVYNAFSHLKTFDFEGTVTAAAVADDGTMAIAVSDEGGVYSTVYLYSGSFDRENKLTKYKYVTSLALSSDGDYLALASVYPAETGEVDSEILYLEVGEKSPEKSHVLQDEAIYGISFFEDDSFVALTDVGARFYDDDGDTVKTVAYENSLPTGSYLGKEGVILLYGTSDLRYQRAYLYNSEGKRLMNAYALDGKCGSIAENENYYCLEVGGKLLSFDKEGENAVTASLPAVQGKLVSNGERVYYATPSYALALDKAEMGR